MRFLVNLKKYDAPNATKLRGRCCYEQASEPVDGILGEARYFGDVTRYLPYIDLGTQLHLGKKTT